MSEQTFVQGDTAPPIRSQIRKEDDTPKDLTGVTVKFQMRKSDDKRYTVDAAASVDDADEGRVSYSWAPNDLAVPGDYICQWELTFGDGRVQTTEPPNEITVRRQ